MTMATGNIDCPFSTNENNLYMMECMRPNPRVICIPEPPITYAELLKEIDSNPALRVVYTPMAQRIGNNNSELEGKRQESEFTGELSINVDCEEESGHSWRPSLANSLSSDFFLPQSIAEVPHLLAPVEEDCPSNTVTGQFSTLQLGTRDEPSAGEPDVACNSELRYPRHDVQSYIESQRSELNVLKYEVMNARRKINESRSAIRYLNRSLSEAFKLQNSQEIKKLTNENAQLRLECQCLCMEVDFYLKGQAPLGEVDEEFYKENNAAHSNNSEVQPHSVQPESRPPHYEAEDMDEGNKWECHKCTFANHPAINCCEICHVQRRTRPQSHCLSEDTCFCHPKEHTPSS